MAAEELDQLREHEQAAPTGSRATELMEAGVAARIDQIIEEVLASPAPTAEGPVGGAAGN